MEQIQNRLGPLVEKVDKQGNILRSLYANGSGGPPGYLEMARAEDKKVQEEDRRVQDKLLRKIDEVVQRVDKFDDFIVDHNAREDQRDKDRIADAAALSATVSASDRKFKRFIAIWSLGIMLFMALVALYDHWPSVRRSFNEPPAPQSQLQPQQDSHIPPLTR